MTQLAQRLTNTGNLLIPGEFNENADSFASGSAYFDGTTTDQYLLVANNAGLFPDSGDFTVEWIQYRLSGGDTNTRIFTIGSWPNARFAVSIEGTTFFFWMNSAIALQYTLTLPFIGAWTWFSVSRQGPNIYLFQNGVLVNTAYNGNAISDNGQGMVIGTDTGHSTISRFHGWITNFRLVKGHCLYSGDTQGTQYYTFPTRPLADVPGTELLLLMTDSADLTTDSSGNQSVSNINAVTWYVVSPLVYTPYYGTALDQTRAYTFDEVTLSQGIIKDGLYAWFDAGNPASYPGSGYTWYDISGSGFTGSLNDIALTSQGGGSMVLNGSTSYIQTNVTDPGSLPISLCFWAQSLSFNRWGLFDSAPTQPNVLRQNNQYTPSNTVEWWNGDPVADLGMSPGQWQYFTINYYFDTQRHVEVIINGVSHTNATGDNDPTYAWTDLVMGCINLSTNFFHGFISQAQIYTRRLSTEEALYNYTIDAGRYGLGGTPNGVRKDFPDGTLQILGHFDEVTLNTVPTDGLLLWLDAANPASYPGSGNTWYDISGNGHDATLYNGASFSTGNSINFVYTSSQYAAFPATNMFTGDFTTAGWVYVRSYQSWSRLFDFGNGAGEDNIIMAVTGGTGGYPVYSVGNNLASPIQLPPNQWVQLASTQSGTVSTLYMNGVAVAVNNQGPESSVTRNYNYIARSNYGSDAYLDGKIASLIMWNRAFTPAEINTLYWATQPVRA